MIESIAWRCVGLISSALIAPVGAASASNRLTPCKPRIACSAGASNLPADLPTGPHVGPPWPPNPPSVKVAALPR